MILAPVLSLLSAAMMRRGAPLFNVTPAFVQSRTAGVAPCGVYVSMFATTCSDPTVDTQKDLIYYIDFGDGSSATYTRGMLAGKSTNTYVGGPTAVHTYTTQGTYTPQGWVDDGTRVWGPISGSPVVVANADATYPTTATTVVSASGDFTGAPSGATQVTSSDFGAVMATHATSNRRVLFRVGETFNASAATNRQGGTVNLYVGTFGGAGYATLQAMASNIQILGGLANGGNPANNPNNWTLTNLHFTRYMSLTGGTAFNVGVIADSADKLNLTKGHATIHNCKVSKLNGGIYMSGKGNVVTDLVTENINEGADGSAGMSIFPNDTLQSGFANCDLDNGHGGEHVVRTQGFQGFAAISNRFRRPAVNKHYLTVRGWGYAAPSYDTKNGSFEYNDFDGTTSTVATAYQCQINPQNTSAYEPIVDILWRNNFHRSISGQQELLIVGRRISVANNVFYRTGVTLGGSTILLTNYTAGLPPTDNIQIYQNTVYATPGGNYSMILEAATVTNTKAFGNIMYAPSASADENGTGSGATMFSSRSTGSGRTQGNNSSTAQIKSTNPQWVGTATTLAGYKLGASSPYIDASINLKVRIDALGYLRNGPTYDAGALNSVGKQTPA